MRKAVFVLCLSILALSISLAARAQAVYGSVVGTVVRRLEAWTCGGRGG